MSSRGRLPRAHASRRTWWLVAAVVVLGTLAYAAWSVVTTRSDLMDARVHADRVQLALQQDDVGDARLFLAQLQEDLSGAHGRTDGPLWALAARLPLVGDDVHAVRTSAAVGDQLAHGPLHELVDGAGSELRERLVPRNGRVDLAAVEEFAPLVSRLRRNLNESAGQLAAVPTGGLTRWTRPAFTALDDRVQAADAAASAADRAVRVLPTMLGQDKPQKYLLLFGNNAEVRATGGLPGAWALVETDAGRISLTRQGAGADFGELDEPVLPLSAAEEAIYDQQLGTFFLDTNFTPEFPRTAELVRAMWRQRFNQRLDGVLSVDAVSMSYLLRSTGLVTAPGGIPLTPENATSELLNRVYFRLEDPEAQNAFFTEVARRVFKKVTTGVRSVPALFEALNQGVAEGRLYVHDFDPLVQRVLAGSPVAGEIRGSDPRVPEVGVYLNDATGSKMSYYLRTRASLRAEGCASGVQQLAGHADLTYTEDSPPVNELPEYVSGGAGFGIPRGEQLVLTRIYGPRGGELSGLRVAGLPTDADVVVDRDRPVATVAVQLRRGETVRVSWRVRSGRFQDRPARLTVTPGMLAAPAEQRVPDRCSE